MGQENYPVAENLADYFDSIGIVNPARRKEAYALMRLDLKAAAAVTAWENRTKYFPFLYGGTETTKRFSQKDVLYPPNDNPILDLGGGFISVSELKVGVTPATPAGTVLTEGTDFFLRAKNAPNKRKPYTWLEFYRSFFPVTLYGSDYPDSIRITGKEGYWTTVEDDAWDAILKYGAYLSYQELALAVSKGRYSVRDLNYEVRYAGANASPLKLEADGWKANFDSTAKQYRRIEL